MILSHLTHRFLAFAGSLTIAAAGVVGAAAPAQSAACSGSNGVTVVVQRPGSTRVDCAQGDPSSALAAFRQVGHTFQAQPSGLICRINSYPDQCVATSEAFWAFWHASSGGSWHFADVGPGSYDPKPGSSVAFRYGSGSNMPPSVAPAAPAPAPKPTTAKPKPTTAAPKPTTAIPRPTTVAPRDTTGPGASPTGGSTVQPTYSGTAKPDVNGSPTFSASPRPGASSQGPESATPNPSPSATASDTASPQKPPSTGSGSSGRLVGGGVLLLALATAVGVVALRRRQAATAAGSAAPTDTPTP